MFSLFSRLETKRKRVIATRQVEILKILLDCETIEWSALIEKTKNVYSSLNNPLVALVRDVQQLLHLGAISIDRLQNSDDEKTSTLILKINLSWPTEISESDFMARIKELPKAKSQSFV